nr:NSP1 [Bat rotavirus]QRV11668.1 NSP1 [Bat rotavirus]
MNSKMYTTKRGEGFNIQYDYLSYKEMWYEKFPTDKPSDCIDMFKDGNYSGDGMALIQKTKAARRGVVAHYKCDLDVVQYEKMPYCGFRMFTHQCCGRMDEHFCGALHPIRTNVDISIFNLTNRPQVASQYNCFIPCGIKNVKFMRAGIPNWLLGTKFRKCMCGKPVMVAGTVLGTMVRLNFISFCSEDYLQIIVNSDRPGKCKICSSPLSTYEATSTWDGYTIGKEYKLQDDICYRCIPVTSIFSLMMKNHTPVVTKKIFEKKRKLWEESNDLRKTYMYPGSALTCANHEDVAAMIVHCDLITDTEIIKATNAAWIRDLTRENIESNPGPINYIQKLNELSQKEAIHQPIYEFEMTVVDEQIAFKCVCYYKSYNATAMGPSKKAAKHLAATGMWKFLNNC